MHELHKVAEIFPPMNDEEFRVLLEDIRENGQQVPIVLHEGKVIDGRHRMKACLQLDIEPITEEFEGESPLSYVISANLARRHLTSSQKSMIAAHLVTTQHGSNQWGEKNEVTGEKVAESLGVSIRQIARGRKVTEKAAPVIKEAVNSGMVSVEDAADIADKPVETQIRAIQKVISGETGTLRSAVNMSEKAELAANPPPLPKGEYRVLVIDPPWPMSKIRLTINDPGVTDLAYPTMELDEITQIQPGKFLHKNAWCFLWTTQRFLHDAIKIVEMWGFYNRFVMVWHKVRGMKPVNLPEFNCEFVVVASKGSPQFVDTKQFVTCFNAPRGEHSVKPQEFYDVVRRVAIGPRIDMFNRREIEGFESWGNESPQGMIEDEDKDEVKSEDEVDWDAFDEWADDPEEVDEPQVPDVWEEMDEAELGHDPYEFQEEV